MNERAATSPESQSAVKLLREAAETLRQAARDATPGRWRWGDPDGGGGGLEQYRSTVQHLPMSTPLTAIRRQRPSVNRCILGCGIP